ncbi:MAG TPA: methyltransferase domain-containing protein [Bacteroidota bacterium]|nr:methyltransferase domain-containing protein [Bacteroidota bacterium]
MINHNGHNGELSLGTQLMRSEQDRVNELFDEGSSYWNDLYSHRDVFGVIHQQRRDVALSFVDELRLPKESRILEAGCGAGLTTLALARRGYTIDAMDSVPAMIELTRQHASQNGLGDSIRAEVGDVHSLKFQDTSFDLIVAMGVTPWLHDLRSALVEIVRVVKPGGYVLLNADNRYRLNHLLDPLLNPVVRPIRESVKRLLESAGARKPSTAARPHMYSVAEFKEYLRSAGLSESKHRMLGFGPFSLLNRKILPDAIGVKVHLKLQKYADLGYPIFRSTGSQYIVLAQKMIAGSHSRS